MSLEKGTMRPKVLLICGSLTLERSLQLLALVEAHGLVAEYVDEASGVPHMLDVPPYKLELLAAPSEEPMVGVIVPRKHEFPSLRACKVLHGDIIRNSRARRPQSMTRRCTFNY